MLLAAAFRAAFLSMNSNEIAVCGLCGLGARLRRSKMQRGREPISRSLQATRVAICQRVRRDKARKTAALFMLVSQSASPIPHEGALYNQRRVARLAQKFRCDRDGRRQQNLFEAKLVIRVDALHSLQTQPSNSQDCKRLLRPVNTEQLDSARRRSSKIRCPARSQK